MKEERNIVRIVQRGKANWIGHIWHRNCLLKISVEGNIRGTGRRGRRRCKQLLDNQRKVDSKQQVALSGELAGEEAVDLS